jgi:hypothetical protein
MWTFIGRLGGDASPLSTRVEVDTAHDASVPVLVR